MTGLESVLLSGGIFLLGVAGTAVASNAGKLSRKEHDENCPKNRGVLEETEHDKQCALIIKPIHEAVHRVEENQKEQFEQNKEIGLSLAAIQTKLETL